MLSWVVERRGSLAGRDLDDIWKEVVHIRNELGNGERQFQEISNQKKTRSVELEPAMTGPTYRYKFW